MNFSKFIFTKILGWKMVGNFPEDLKKYVLIGAPHTSWHDFYIGLLVRNATNLKMNFIGKASLFKPPFGFFFRALGGTPVDRSKSTNLVDAIVQLFNQKEEFKLALSPEGTRKKVDKWKTGFYYIAQGANVPIVMLGFDFENKKVLLSQPYNLTNNKEIDFSHFSDFYKDIKGKIPENSQTKTLY